MRPIENNTALLDLLLKHSEKSSDLWRPTNYWRPYCERICKELRKSGLDDFRQNQRILKGYASGGLLTPVKPVASWKRFIWNSTENLPIVRRIVDSYKKINRVYHQRYIDHEITIAKLALEKISKDYPNLKIPSGLENGSADDCFVWNGSIVSANWVRYLSIVADFYKTVSLNEVTVIGEIGPGIGLNSLAHKALNPNLKTIINIDIAPIIYVSGQFLKSIKEVHVVDFSETEKMDKIDLLSNVSNDETTIYCLPPWEFKKIEGDIDYFFNAYSFQEMEKEICDNYSKIIMALTQKGILLHSHVAGHKPDAGNQTEPVTLGFLENIFTGQYPHITTLGGVWPTYYQGKIEETRLMQKKAA